MTDRDRLALIQSLSKNLNPIKKPGNILIASGIWLLVSWLYVIFAAIQIGPIRVGALQALTQSSHFALESTTGLMVSGLFCLLAFRESIPGRDNDQIMWLAILVAAVWVGIHIIGIITPALEPSMEGKRAHCVMEAFFYSIPPLLLGYSWIFRRYPLNTIRTGVYLGISAGAIPALLMQFACMYKPMHILSHHIAPIMVITLIGALTGFLFSKKTPSPSTLSE